MTAEELKAIEGLTNEIKELNRSVKALTLLKYAEIRCMNSDLKPTDHTIRRRVEEGKALINAIKDE